ncbi:MAG: phosphonoacetaldehyde hydrolase [Clostridium chrysemydis]|uniref:phosphonoacetaldehyde hydrolase n=1 Tax=Clostridium TaxID=1485 RepID=UPI00215364BB|nr:phosphonoacetaldehyde hydrolase [Clostridium sp. LY3-2]MCR6515980.1 phosphonoacetaldehyde hydrolase [Clostridium sp. LY3-2]
MNNIKCVIFDWAGTTVDFGCFAPVNVFIQIFKNAGIDVTNEEARLPMGMLKIDHIREMLNMERIRNEWKFKYKRDFTEEDVNNLYKEFEPALLKSLKDYTDIKPNVLETINTLRERGIKIGSTTGYTDKMMEIVVKEAKKKGYSPDFYITPDSTSSLGRPYPYMIFRNMEELKILSPKEIIKVGDTNSDILEGKNAGVTTVGITVGSSNMGLSKEEYDSLSDSKKREARERVREGFFNIGADHVIDDIREICNLI